MVSTLTGKAVTIIIQHSADVYRERTDLPEITKGLKGAMVGILDDAVGEFYRKLILAYLFKPGKKLEPISSKTLEPAQWQALLEWVDPFKDEVTRKWRSGRSSFSDEITAVLTDAIKEFYTDTPQKARDMFGEYDAGSLVAGIVSLGGVITSAEKGGAENDDITIRPIKNRPVEGYGNYLDRLLFGDDDPGDPVNF